MPAAFATYLGLALPIIQGPMTGSDTPALAAAVSQAGGLGMLKALAGPFPDVVFCPTGGINAATAPDFLALPNVACVGGSWLTPADAVASGDWARVESLAREAAALARQGGAPA